MTFTNLEKYVYSKKLLKTTTSTLLPLSPAKSKVFSRRKSHLATAVIGADLYPFQARFVIGWENNGDGDITMPLSLKTIGSAGYRDQ